MVQILTNPTNYNFLKRFKPSPLVQDFLHKLYLPLGVLLILKVWPRHSDSASRPLGDLSTGTGVTGNPQNVTATNSDSVGGSHPKENNA